MKKILKLTSLTLAIFILFSCLSSCSIIKENMYTTSLENGDTYITAEINGNELTITIFCIVEVKNLKYNIRPTRNSERYYYEKEYVEPNEPLIHKYKIDNNEKEFSFGWNVTGGFTKNKNPKREERIKFNECTFSYEILKNFETSNGQVYKLNCYITNNTNKEIISLNTKSNCKIGNDAQDITLFISDYKFDTPLQPGETRKVVIKNNIDVRASEGARKYFVDLIDEKINLIHAAKTENEWLCIIYK